MSKTFNNSILSVRDTEGNIINIPAIKGDKGDSGVYVGSGIAPKGTNVQVDPNGEDEIIIPDVLQTIGNSEVDTMSQKTITDELSKLRQYVTP